MTAQVLPFRIAHATTDPERTRRALAQIQRGVWWRVRWFRAKRWARAWRLVLAGVAIAALLVAVIL